MISTHAYVEKCQKMLLLFYIGLIPDQTMSDYIIEKYFYEWSDQDIGSDFGRDYRRITEKSNKVKLMNLLNLMVTHLSTCTKGSWERERDFECSLSVMS